LQKVSAQREVSRPAPQTVLNGGVATTGAIQATGWPNKANLGSYRLFERREGPSYRHVTA